MIVCLWEKKLFELLPHITHIQGLKYYSQRILFLDPRSEKQFINVIYLCDHGAAPTPFLRAEFFSGETTWGE